VLERDLEETEWETARAAGVVVFPPAGVAVVALHPPAGAGRRWAFRALVDARFASQVQLPIAGAEILQGATNGSAVL
jgi:hypothetical protein